MGEGVPERLATVDSSTAYVQLVASHRQCPERLLLRDRSGQCYLWFGDDRAMEVIEAPVADWISDRPEMYQLESPLLWFDVTSLPLEPGSAGPDLMP